MVLLLLNFLAILCTYCLYLFLPNQCRTAESAVCFYQFSCCQRSTSGLLQMWVFCEEKEDLAKWY